MGKKNDLLSAVASDDVVDCIKHLVEYLSCRVFSQAIYRHMTSIGILIVIYINNILIISKNKAKIKALKKSLIRKFKIEDLGPIEYFIGVRITQNRKEGIITLY